MKGIYRIINGNGHYEDNALISDEEMMEDYLSNNNDEDSEEFLMASYLWNKGSKQKAIDYVAYDWEMNIKLIDDIVQCPICGGRVTFMGDCKVNDAFEDSKGFGDDAIVQDYICLECGRLISITDPTDEEKSTHYKKYWSNTD